MTPADIKKGERFVALKTSPAFDEGSIVEFTGGYGRLGSPTMKLIEGGCIHNNAPDGEPGAHQALKHFKRMSVSNEELITLAPGDYIATADLSEEDYHKVARAFMAAGAYPLEYSEDGSLNDEWKYFGWSYDNDLEFWDNTNSFAAENRQLTLSQILSATNAGNDTDNNAEEVAMKQFKVGDKVVLNGHRNNGDDFYCGYCSNLVSWNADKTIVEVVGDAATKGCLHVSDGLYTRAVHPSEIDHAEQKPTETNTMHLADQLESAIRAQSEANAEVGRLQAEWRAAYPGVSGCADIDVEDIKPEDWRVGDVVECVKEDGEDVTKGKMYTIIDPLYRWGDITICDDAGDNCDYPWDDFQFIRRP